MGENKEVEKKASETGETKIYNDYADFGVEGIRELLGKGQYTSLRKIIEELNDADIADYMEEMEEEEVIKIFRILPKDTAADVFSYLEIDRQQSIITSLSDKDAARIIDNMMSDDG